MLWAQRMKGERMKDLEDTQRSEHGNMLGTLIEARGLKLNPFRLGIGKKWRSSS